MEQEQTLPRVVTLVHGTWAPHATWTSDDSPLCRKIKQIPGIEITRFEWSGDNTVEGRAVATCNFRRHLIDQFTKWPGSQQFIIAHSHGGNVAAYALQEDSIRARVSGVACLSTPFLHLSARPYLASIVPYIIACILGVLMLTVVAIALFVCSKWGSRNIVLFSSFICCFLGVFFVWIYAEKPLKRYFQRLEGRARSLIDNAHYPELNLLIVRCTGDEASDAITFAHFSSSMIDWAWWIIRAPNRLVFRAQVRLRKLIRHGSLMIQGLFLVTTLLVLIGFAYFTWLKLSLLTVAVVSSVLCTLISIPLAVLLMFFAIAFGMDLRFLALFINVAVEASPPGFWEIHQLDPSKISRRRAELGGRSLMHSTHSNPEAINLVWEW